jgi:hypothetical protein
MRRRMTKESKIARALRKGYHPKAVAEYYNTSLNYVYKVRLRHMNLRSPLDAPPPEKLDQGSAPEPARVPVEIVSLAATTPHPTPQPIPAGLVTLQSEIPQPTAGIGPLPLGSGEVVVKKPEPSKPTLWQRFKLWAWGRS